MDAYTYNTYTVKYMYIAQHMDHNYQCIHVDVLSYPLISNLVRAANLPR